MATPSLTVSSHSSSGGSYSKKIFRRFYLGLIAFIFFSNSFVIGLIAPQLEDFRTKKGLYNPMQLRGNQSAHLPVYVVFVTVVSALSWTVSVVIFACQLFTRRKSANRWFKIEVFHTGFMSILWLSVVSVTHGELGRGCGAFEMLLYAVNSEDYFTAATMNITQRQISCQFLATIGIFVVMVWIAYNGYCFFILAYAVHNKWGENDVWNVARVKQRQNMARPISEADLERSMSVVAETTAPSVAGSHSVPRSWSEGSQVAAFQVSGSGRQLPSYEETGMIAGTSNSRQVQFAAR